MDCRPAYEEPEQGVARLEKEVLARMKAENALREWQKKYREIFENVSDLCFQHGLDGRIHEINLAFKSEWGYSDEDIFNMNIKDLIPERFKPQFDDYVKEILQKGEAEGILRCVTKEGHERLVEYNAALFHDEKGKPMGIRGIGRDITDRVAVEKEKAELENQVVRAQKMEAIGTLAGGIAHDFNNILFPILGYAEMAMENVPEDSVARGNLEEVFKAAGRAKGLVQQILTFSRQTEQERKPLRIQFIMKEVLKLLRPSLPSTIDIRLDMDENCGPVLADPVQVHQVLMNLCTNAYHAMREKGGVLEVTLTEKDIESHDSVSDVELDPGSYLKLTVSDTGHGMDPRVMEQIFNPYFTTKAPGEGTGLGLSVVHGIVKSYGGQITVHSKPREGTRFHIYLPLIDAGPVVSETLSQEPAPKGTEHILLVDDEPPIVRVMQQMLESLGYHVTARTRSLDALEAFCVRPEMFDLVITDQTMPYMMGTELAQKVRSITPHIPILLCTGSGDANTEEKAQAMGIQATVMKPIAKSDMAKTVRRLLDGEREK